MAAVVWPGLAWAAQRASRGSAGNRMVGVGEQVCRLLAWMWVPAPSGPRVFLTSRVWGHSLLSVSIHQVGEGTEAAGAGGHFSGPRCHMTPGPRPSRMCWLQLQLSCGTRKCCQEWRPAAGGAVPMLVCPWLSPSPGCAKMGRAYGPTPSESRGTSIFSPSLLALPVSWPSLPLPLSHHFQRGDHPETIYSSC